MSGEDDFMRRMRLQAILAQNPSLTQEEAAAWDAMQTKGHPKTRTCCPCQTEARAEVVSHKGKRCLCPVGICKCRCHLNQPVPEGEPS